MVDQAATVYKYFILYITFLSVSYVCVRARDIGGTVCIRTLLEVTWFKIDFCKPCSITMCYYYYYFLFLLLFSNYVSYTFRN